MVNIVEPYAELLTPRNEIEGQVMLQNIELYGRVSHRSEDLQTESSWERFIQSVVLTHGDWSIVEHCSATVEFLVDRGITHEIVRHRHFSYTQESTRFVNYTKEGHPPQFVDPFSSAPVDPDPAGDEAEDRLVARNRNEWEAAILDAESRYKGLLQGGASPQIARSVLPNALASKIIMTGTLRAWRHFLIMRTTREAHPQMRQVAVPLLAQFKKRVPLLYDDIEPNARQADNLRLPE